MTSIPQRLSFENRMTRDSRTLAASYNTVRYGATIWVGSRHSDCRAAVRTVSSPGASPSQLRSRPLPYPSRTAGAMARDHAPPRCAIITCSVRPSLKLKTSPVGVGSFRYCGIMYVSTARWPVISSTFTSNFSIRTWRIVMAPQSWRRRRYAQALRRKAAPKRLRPACPARPSQGRAAAHAGWLQDRDYENGTRH